jgi:hypothetical protein
MKIRRFVDLNIWQKAQDLAVIVYQVFDNCRDYGFKDQIRRATEEISRMSFMLINHLNKSIN